MNVFVFDIETMPDVESGRHLLNLGNELPDASVAQAMQQYYRQRRNSDFLPHHLHRIAAISVLLRKGDTCKVWSLGDEGAPEKELIERFFHGLDKCRSNLVSWNGAGFDLPVLHYRALLHGIEARQYWETGDNDSHFRWNNYLGRFHWRHVDLMDVLSGYQPRAVAPLEDIAVMLGLPGKMGMHGSRVWECFLQGDIQAIRNYCETDVLNTYLVYLRFERMRGHLSNEGYRSELQRVRDMLADESAPHFSEFLNSWQ